MPSAVQRLLPMLAVVALAASGQTPTPPDLTKQPTLYVVPYAHLDTQWRWEFPQTISEYLLKTLKVNFYYLDHYPHYVFNWTGSNRYRLMKEYYPADYAKMKTYVEAGRWFPAGSSVEEGDVNLPSAESLFRQILYGNAYYRREFGKASEEYMLPDCFGFPASLPTILAHAGIKGFSTQKLGTDWQPAPRVGGPSSPEQTPEGIPFNVGLWEGTDGGTVVAALNPLEYVSGIKWDLSKTPPPSAYAAGKVFGKSSGVTDWVSRIDLDGKRTGVFADYHYIGTGDIGGATDEQTVRFLEAIVTHGTMDLPRNDWAPGVHPVSASQADAAQGVVRVGDGPVHVIASTSDRMFRDLRPEMLAKLPRYKGDLELINHSAGSLTSEAYHKRWNRENELLADAAERASVAAAWMGGVPYPQQRLNDAWTLVLSGQFHDLAAGTATPRAYEFAQNDDVIALNQFADVLTSATASIASTLDTATTGTPVVVYNPLAVAREDVVEAQIPSAPADHRTAHVIAPSGAEVPAQREGTKVVFVARVPSVGYAVYDVRFSNEAPAPGALHVSSHSLENARYRVTLNEAGDVSSIFDKQLNRELLAAPFRLALSNDAPRQWPAWNMDFDQEQAAPRAYVGGPATLRVVENGPARVAVEVTRETEGSRFVQTIRLSAGDGGNRVEINDAIDWHSSSANLKASFPLAASNPLATYNWEVGTVQRPTAFDRQFEVASHHWIDLTDSSGAFGVTLLTGAKNGSDKRDDRTLRLTLLRTPGQPEPGPGGNYPDQLNQDWGHHDITYGIAGHAGSWQSAHTDWQAYRLSSPLRAFVTVQHPGSLGREFSLLHTDTLGVRILAIKKAETSDDIIVRAVELNGESQPHVTLSFAAPVASAREVTGQELPLGAATVQHGAVVTSFKPYQPRTFAIRLAPATVQAAPLRSEPVSLPYNLAASSKDDQHSSRGFDLAGDALPAEMLPQTIAFNGIAFHLAPGGAGSPDAVIAHGQTLTLPAGDYSRAYILAASADGDRIATFRAGDHDVPLRIEGWGGFVGQWDTRLWKPRPATGMIENDPKRLAPLRHDWAVSANHATWNDITYRGSPWWAPRFPEDYLGLAQGYIKPAPIAWYASHHHTAQGLNEPYQYSYLFAYMIDLPAHARTLTLPMDANIRVLAISVARDFPDLTAAEPLYDSLDSGTPRPGEYVRTEPQR